MNYEEKILEALDGQEETTFTLAKKLDLSLSGYFYKTLKILSLEGKIIMKPIGPRITLIKKIKR